MGLAFGWCLARTGFSLIYFAKRPHIRHQRHPRRTHPAKTCRRTLAACLSCRAIRFTLGFQGTCAHQFPERSAYRCQRHFAHHRRFAGWPWHALWIGLYQWTWGVWFGPPLASLIRCNARLYGSRFCDRLCCPSPFIRVTSCIV